MCMSAIRVAHCCLLALSTQNAAKQQFQEVVVFAHACFCFCSALLFYSLRSFLIMAQKGKRLSRDPKTGSQYRRAVYIRRTYVRLVTCTRTRVGAAADNSSSYLIIVVIGLETVEAFFCFFLVSHDIIGLSVSSAIGRIVFGLYNSSIIVVRT